MKKLIKLTLTTFVGMTILTNPLSADVGKGQKLYSKQLKSKCHGLSGSDFAAKHSQDEWEEIYDAGKLGEEIKKICSQNPLNEKLLPHIYDFAYEYANDSGNVPNC